MFDLQTMCNYANNGDDLPPDITSDAIEEIGRLQFALEQANEDAERLASSLGHHLIGQPEGFWPVSRRALEAHKERLNK